MHNKNWLKWNVWWIFSLVLLSTLSPINWTQIRVAFYSAVSQKKCILWIVFERQKRAKTVKIPLVVTLEPATARETELRNWKGRIRRGNIENAKYKLRTRVKKKLRIVKVFVSRTRTMFRIWMDGVSKRSKGEASGNIAPVQAISVLHMHNGHATDSRHWISEPM